MPHAVISIIGLVIISKIQRVNFNNSIKFELDKKCRHVHIWLCDTFTDLQIIHIL